MSAVCVFTNNAHKNISGNVIFTETKRGLQIKINISGISPGKHGFHIHEYGDLSEGCGSLCSHYNPHNKTHGDIKSKNRHVGDLGNIKPNKYGIYIEKKEELLTYKYNSNESIANAIGADDIYYNSLENVVNLVRSMNLNIKNMEVSMFINNDS